MNAFQRHKHWLSLAAAVGILVVTVLFRDTWWPRVSKLISDAPASAQDGHGADDAHAGHDHAGHDDGNSLELSDKALQNIGYRPLTVKRSTFTKTTTVPAMVVERPGRSQIEVTAPMTGVVKRVFAIEGEAVEPGQPLFEIRLTHEDLVTAQRDFLRSVEELDVANQELDRLVTIGDAIKGSRVLDQKYKKQMIEAALHAQSAGLELHGLSKDQVAKIRKDRNLLESLTIVAPQGTDDCVFEGAKHLLNVQKLSVRPGQHVASGTALCVLGDHCRLYIEGKAFEEDAELLNQLALKKRKVSAVRISRGAQQDAVADLEILYLADRVESGTRAFHFYIGLPNKLIRNERRGNHHFIGWKYKPGQRFEVHVPIKQDADRMVLPVDAVVEEGAQAYVFQRNGGHFDRVEVVIVDRDQDVVEIKDDGSLYPGDVIAASGAYDMYLHMKNQAGGGVDPHAGHSH